MRSLTVVKDYFISNLLTSRHIKKTTIFLPSPSFSKPTYTKDRIRGLNWCQIRRKLCCVRFLMELLLLLVSKQTYPECWQPGFSYSDKILGNSSLCNLNCLRVYLLFFISCLVVSDSLRPNGLHARLSYPSPAPEICSNSCPLSCWCHPTISAPIAPSPPAFNVSQHQGLF